MAQLSRLAQLYLKISDNLTEDDVRNLRSLLSIDEVLGKGKVEKATPLEIFNMLVDNATIGKGNLGFLVQILRCLGKGKFADEAELLETEHRIEGKKTHATTAMTPESGDSRGTTDQGDSATADSELEDTEVKEIISAEIPSGAAATPDYQQTLQTLDNEKIQQVTSELASLHIRELERLTNEPMKMPGLWPNELGSSADDQDVQTRLETLLAELDTPAVMADQEKQFDLYCQIGDLYRAKLYNLQSALQYYQSMLECSKSLPGDVKQAKAHNRLGLTFDMLSNYDEAIRNHVRVLDTCKVAAGRDIDRCVVYKNLASSLTLSGKVSDAKTNYRTALRLATETQNKIEEMDIRCKLGDLHRVRLNEPQVAHTHYAKMLALAKDSGRNYWEMQAYNRLGLTCGDMQDNALALEWHQMSLAKSLESADKRDQIIAQLNVGASLGKVNQAKSHLDTGLQMAQQKGDQYGQMTAYMHMGDMQREKFNSPRTAIQYYEQALALARQLGDRHQEGWVYSRLGHAHVEQREYEEALGWYEKHLRVSREREDKKEEVTTHTTLGNVYRLLGQLDQATSHFDTALQMAEQTEDLHGQMEVYCKMGDLQREQLHSPRASVKHYEQYLALARQLLNRVEEALAYERLGHAHYDMGEYEKALKWYQKHLDLSQDNGDSKQQIRAHTNLGKTYRLLGKQDQATHHISTALQMAEQTGDQHGQMQVYFSMGEMQMEQLHSPRASVQYYEQHLALARQLGDRHWEGTAYNRLGLAHHDIGEYEAAVEWHQKNLKIRQESGDKANLLVTHQCIAASYKALGKLDLARSSYQSAMTIAKETGNKQQQMKIYRALGDLHREPLHEPHVAQNYYTEMLAIARDSENKEMERVACNRLGRAHYAMGEYETSLEWDKRGLKMNQENGDQLITHKNMADSYTALGKLDLARSHYQSAMTLAIETGSKQQQENIANRMASL